MGNVHRYGDQRMPIPGILGIIAAAASALAPPLSGATAFIENPWRVFSGPWRGIH
jgi:hypothetical protein